MSKRKITERIDQTNDMSVPEWLSTTPPCPKSVKISLDDNCQFKCSFCVNSTQKYKPSLEWTKFTNLIDELVANGTEEIGLFFIGEPMLAKSLEAAIHYCKSVGVPYVFITTNGALATAKRVKPLMRAGLNSIKYSYNYTDGKQLKDVAHVPERIFNDLVKNIKEVRAMRDAGGYDCGIYASSINFTGEQGELMRKAVDLIKDDVDEHYWLPQYSFGAQTSFGEQVLGNPGRLANQREPLPCWTIFKEGHVTAGGSVALCCFDVHDKWSAGNIHETTFMEAWHSPAAQALRQAHLNKDARGTACESCAHGHGRRTADKKIIEILGVPV